jgi:hypothetical protein
LLTAATMIMVRSRPPPSVAMVLAIAVTTSYIVSTGPALVAGFLCTSLALRWQSHGLSRRSIVRRLAGVGTAVGGAAAVVGGSLAEAELVVDPQYLAPGCITGFLMGLTFPRALWGASRASVGLRE